MELVDSMPIVSGIEVFDQHVVHDHKRLCWRESETEKKDPMSHCAKQEPCDEITPTLFLSQSTTQLVTSYQTQSPSDSPNFSKRDMSSV